MAIAPAILLSVVVCLVPPTAAQEESANGPSDSEGVPKFGGPDAVGTTVEEDAKTGKPFFKFGFFQPYHEFKTHLAEQSGVSYGIDYTAVYLGASDSLGQDDASSGMFRFYGSWDLFGRESGNTGALVWKIEDRHRFGTIPPSSFSFELGNIGLFEPPFSDQGARLTNLYWRQRLKQGRVAFVGGFLDATDYVDVFGLGSPWVHFMNFAFTTGTTTISLPNDALLGFAVAAMVTDKLYVIGGFGDTNSDPTEPWDGFDTFFDDHEYFSHFEVGWTTSHDRIYFDNVHFTVWHADERIQAGVQDDWGINFSFSHYVRDRWMPFVRAGWADKALAFMKKSASAGIAFQPVPGRDLLGIGVNWGEPADSFGTALDDQYAVEVFYRLQLSDELAITPDVQLLLDPALNPQESSVLVYGLRLRLAL